MILIIIAIHRPDQFNQFRNWVLCKETIQYCITICLIRLNKTIVIFGNRFYTKREWTKKNLLENKLSQQLSMVTVYALLLFSNFFFSFQAFKSWLCVEDTWETFYSWISLALFVRSFEQKASYLTIDELNAFHFI